MPDGKRCWKSLGLEQLAVGRSGLLPLRGTANSPFTPMVYLPDGKRCWKSLGLEQLAVGRSGLLPLCGTANSPFTLMV